MPVPDQELPDDSTELLTDLYALVRDGAIDQAVDAVLCYVDGLLATQDFATCDQLLCRVDVDQLDTNLIVAILLSTLRAAQHLWKRPAFVQCARTRLTQLAPDRAERLLARLDTPTPAS